MAGLVGTMNVEVRHHHYSHFRDTRVASRLEHEAPSGGVLLSFETYALVKDKVNCEERGQVQVKGLAQPVATYAVVGRNRESEQASTEHLRLELEIDRMSDDERKAAADTLRRALGLLEKRRLRPTQELTSALVGAP